MKIAATFVISLLCLAMLVCITVDVFSKFRLGGCFDQEPYYKRHANRCIDYTRRRLLGEQGLDPPAQLPAALITAIITVSGIMVVFAVIITMWVTWKSHQWQKHAIPFARWLFHTVEPFLALALEVMDVKMSISVDLDMAEYIAWSITITFYIALGSAVCFEMWLLWKTQVGYRYIFRQMVRGKPYLGCSAVQASPDSFHPAYSTFFAGALFGTAMLSFWWMCMTSWLVLAVLSSPQLWNAIWSAREYWIVYLLTYLTRRFLVYNWSLKRIVGSNGQVWRPRVWALAYPTLMIYNFVLGTLNGVIRGIFSSILLTSNFFRIDTSLLPEQKCSFDFGYQPFLCLVLHAYRRTNPILIAVVVSLSSGSAAQKRSDAESKFQLTFDSKSVHSGMPNVAWVPSTLTSPTAIRARNRWHLAVLLLRNPSLRALRSHAHNGKRISASRIGTMSNGDLNNHRDVTLSQIEMSSSMLDSSLISSRLF